MLQSSKNRFSNSPTQHRTTAHPNHNVKPQRRSQMAITSAAASTSLNPGLQGLAMQQGQLVHALQQQQQQAYQQQLLAASKGDPLQQFDGRQLMAHGGNAKLNVSSALQPPRFAAADLFGGTNNNTAVTGALLHSMPQHVAAADPKQRDAAALKGPANNSNAAAAADFVSDPQLAAPAPPQQQQQQQHALPPRACSPAPSSAVPTPAASSGSPTPGASTPATAQLKAPTPPAAATAAAAAGPEHDKPAAAAAGATAAPAAEQRFQLPAPSPLPAPDPAEGPEAAAEHARYMERWREGATLAQRWHRLSQRGVLGDIVEEWEEWQHDLLLQELHAQNAAAARHARKHRRDGPDVDMDAPRQTRTRRVPTALQDYQVEAAMTGTPEPQLHISSVPSAGVAVAPGPRSAAGAAGGRAAAAQHATAQRLHAVALDDADMKYGGGDGAVAAMAATGAGAQGAPRQGRGGGRGGGRGMGADAAAAAAASVPQAHLAFTKQTAAHVVPGPQQQYGVQYHNQQQQQAAQQYAYGGPAYKQQQQQAQQQPQWQQQQQRQRQLLGQQQQLLQPPAMPGYHAGHAVITSSTQDLSGRVMSGHMGVGGGHYGSSTAGDGTVGPIATGHPNNLISTGRPPVTTVIGGGGPVGLVAAPAAGVGAPAPVSLPAGYAAAVGPMGPSVELNAAFDAFTRTLGRVDPNLFMRSCGLMLAQQQQQRQQQ